MCVKLSKLNLNQVVFVFEKKTLLPKKHKKPNLMAEKTQKNLMAGCCCLAILAELIEQEKDRCVAVLVLRNMVIMMR